MTAHEVLGFLFDPNRCTGCAACSLACSTENGLAWGTSWRQVVPFNPERRPGVPSFHLSLACNHCAEAPCVAHCPTGAMRRDPHTGAVVVDEATCIGCRYCSWVCPYDAPSFDADRGVMTKCTLCNHRLLEGRQPACAEACPTGALGYGTLAGEDRIPGFPDEPWSPRIRFTALRRDAKPPESSWTLPDDALAAFGPNADAPPPGISFRAELPLWLFTSGMAGLVGWVMAAALGGGTPPPAGFAAVAAVLLLVSTLHLGSPSGAWRAIANVRTSHLSREIAGVNAFLAATLLWMAWDSRGGAAAGFLGWGAAGLGLLSLFLVDRVYDPVRPAGRGLLHGADTLLMGPLFAAALLQALWPFVALAVLKAVLYRRRTAGGALILLLAGLAVPPVAWVVFPSAWSGWTLILVAAEEVAARAGFYRELLITSPARLAREAAAMWRAA